MSSSFMFKILHRGLSRSHMLMAISEVFVFMPITFAGYLCRPPENIIIYWCCRKQTCGKSWRS